jgi:hypothetical protein
VKHAPHPFERKLARALDRMGGLWLVSDILKAVDANDMQMFAEGDSIALTRLALYPRAKVLEIVLVTGKIEALRILHDRILTYAANNDASVIQAYGRKGWMADAQKRGWKIKARSFVYQREM